MPNFKKNWPCSTDCKCALCLELHDIKQPPTAQGYFNPRLGEKRASKKKKGPDLVPNDNFILKKSLYDLKQMSLLDFSHIKKAQSYQEISEKFGGGGGGVSKLMLNKKVSNSMIEDSKLAADHRTVIYFGDSIRRPPPPPKVEAKAEDDYHARRLCEELNFKRERSIRKSKNFSVVRPAPEVPNNLMQQLKTVLQEKAQHAEMSTVTQIKLDNGKITEKKIQIPEPVFSKSRKLIDKSGVDGTLPSFIESVINGVISIRIEHNFEAAKKIVSLVNEREPVVDGIEFSEEDADEQVDFDWSFVQDWRSR